MGTKLRKWKSIVSSAAFFLGVSLVLNTVSGYFYKEASFGSSFLEVKESLLDDYQETREFSDYISGRLACFLAMACDMVYFLDYGETEDFEFNGLVTEEVVQGSADAITREWHSYQEETAASYIYDNWKDWYDWNGRGEEEYRDINREEAQEIHEALKDDKNLLYDIRYGEELMFTNAENLEEYGKSGAAPEGYSFILYYDGNQAAIYKDGKKLDVYGDGYYREESRWYMPGYRNFPAADNMKNAVVTIAAAADPVSYSQNGGSYNTSSAETLYYMAQGYEKLRRSALSQAAQLAAGILLLLVYVLLRREKRIVDQAAAAVTGRLWFEVKLFVLLMAALGCFAERFNRITSYNVWDYSDGGIVSSLWSSQQHFAVSSGAVLFLFWTAWFFVNDMRFHPGVWKHGVCYKLYRVFRAGEERTSIARRYSQWCVMVSGLCILYVFLCFAAIVAGGDAGFDKPVTVNILFGTGLLLLCTVLYFYMRKTVRMIRDLELLTRRITQIRNGQYGAGKGAEKASELGVPIRELEEIREGMEAALEEQLRSQRLKVELIANVSHDIKTPLTSIISYVQFLKEEKELPGHVQDYIRILDEKSQRLKKMVQDVFAVSKAASGELPVNMEALDFGKLLSQTMADMEEEIQSGSVSFRTQIPDEPVMIRADGERLYRVFQNLILNAVRYSLDGSRVYLTLKTEQGTAVASIKNISRAELDPQVNLLERFTRGDASRTDGGSGLGLSIAQSFTEACGGAFGLETIADLFVVTVSFPLLLEETGGERV